MFGNSDSDIYKKKSTPILIFIGIIAVGTILLLYSDGSILKGGIDLQVSDPTIKKAAIINMLDHKLPNPEFIENATRLLESDGYQVDLYSTEEITIELYKKLPTLDYQLILFRTHGLNEGTIENSATIFSGEVYDVNNHLDEQWAKQVRKAVPYTAEEVEQIGWDNLVNQTYFTIGSKFVEEAMEGQFSDTQILIGGCDSLSGIILAESFVNRGASFVIGWDNLISSKNNDEGMLLVLSEIVNGTLPEDATKKAMEKLQVGPVYDGKLKIYSSNI